MGTDCMRRTTANKQYIKKPFKSKVAELEEDIFGCRAARHATQCTKALKHIANHVQWNYKIKVDEVVMTLKEQNVYLPTKSVTILTKDSKKDDVRIKPDETDLYAWRE